MRLSLGTAGAATAWQHRRHAVPVLLSCAVVVLLAAGCDGDAAPRTAPLATTRASVATGIRTPTTTASSDSVPATLTASSTSTPNPTAQAVLAAYTGMWADMASAARTADYSSPALGAHTVDPATGQLQRMLLTLHNLGWVAKGQPAPHPTVVSLSTGQPPTAQITDCLDETHWLTYRADTGALTDNKPGERYAVTAVARQDDGGWKVESFEVAAGGSC